MRCFECLNYKVFIVWSKYLQFIRPYEKEKALHMVVQQWCLLVTALS
uniref:Uncharacterized protein n=1 Tax=Anguilla anguilla TaxID=7936 RepID=A0A0E9T2M4_ANGAN